MKAHRQIISFFQILAHCCRNKQKCLEVGFCVVSEMQSLFNLRLWKAFDSMQTHAVVRKRISLNSLGFCYLTAEKTLFKIYWNIHTVKSIMFWRFSWGLKGLLKSSVNDVEPILKSRTLYSNNLQYTQIGKCLLISLPYWRKVMLLIF